MKFCKGCNSEKPLDQFYRNKARLDGYESLCKECTRSKNRMQYAKHAEARRDAAATYRANHQKEVAERNRLYRAEHRDELNAYRREWGKTHQTNRSDESKAKNRQASKDRYANNPDYREKVKVAAKQRYANPENKAKIKAAMQAWNKKNPHRRRSYHLNQINKLTPEERKAKGLAHRERYRISRQAYMARYNAMLSSVPGEISNDHLYYLHKWQDHCCFYCRDPLNGNEHVEHVVPRSRQGTNFPHNVVLACQNCNLSKNDKIYSIEWLPDHIQSEPRFHSLHQTDRLKLSLQSEKVEFQEYHDHLQIGDRRIFILSSFWLGWKGDSVIKNFALKYPKSLLFFDKEFARHSDAIVNVLKAKAKIASRIGARKLQLAIPSPEEAKSFVDKWHALGFTNGDIYLGLRDVSQWHAIAIFRKNYHGEFAPCYEVIRMTFCGTVAGGVSRIISHFRKMAPENLPIVAYTDQRMGDGASHFPAGFTAIGETKRNFLYATPEQDGFFARRTMQKNALARKADFFDETITQIENAKANGIMRVEGLPLLRFIIR